MDALGGFEPLISKIRPTGFIMTGLRLEMPDRHPPTMLSQISLEFPEFYWNSIILPEFKIICQKFTRIFLSFIYLHPT